MRKTVTQTRCGAFSVVHGVPQILVNSQLVAYTRDECLKIAGRRYIEVSTTKGITFPLGERVTQQVYSRGSIAKNFACNTVPSDDGHAIVESVEYEVFVKEDEAKYFLDTGMVHFKEKTLQCEVKHNGCVDKLLGTFAWPAQGQVPCERRYAPLFTDTAGVLYQYHDQTGNNPMEMVLLQQEDSGKMVAFTLRPTSSVCRGLVLRHTTQEGVFVVFLDDNQDTIPLEESPIFDLATHIASLASSSYASSHLQAWETTKKIETLICDSARERKLLLLTLLQTQPSAVLHELVDVDKAAGGITVIRTGSVAVVIQCYPVTVTQRITDECFQARNIIYTLLLQTLFFFNYQLQLHFFLQQNLCALCLL